MPPLGIPLAGSKFNLNSAGVAGFFGGEEAISAMATVHLYEGRQWLGWFNSPGSYTIAKHFGRTANSRLWDGLFPGPNDSPAVSLGLDGKKGPQYTAALSGTTMRTRHLAHLTMEWIRELKVEEEIKKRPATSCDVAYLAMKHVDYDTPVKRLPLKGALLGLIPISVSVFTCVICALVYDWFSFSMILIGIISSGCASLVIGNGEIVIESVKEPATGAPPGHGILIEGNEVVVIKGNERDVNAITKGRFELKTGSKQGDKRADDKKKAGDEEKARGKKTGVRNYHMIGVCSLVLLVQFLVQLLLVPQGTLFGQIMFLASLGVSWGYISYLSSLEKEKIQTRLLFQTLGNPEMLRFRVGTRTTMAVFVCLLVFHGVPRSTSKDLDCAHRVRILHDCIPNDTDVWKRWREKVVEQLLNIDDKPDSLQCLMEDERDRGFSEQDGALLQVLLEDARAAFRGYCNVRGRLPDDSSRQVTRREAEKR